MKTRPFNLEEALNGAKVVTRDGREVKKLTYFDASKNDHYPLYGVVGTLICCWTITGQHHIDTDNNHNDLFLSVEPKRIWVNVYQHDGMISIGSIYKTKKEARRKAVDNVDMQYIKTIKITDKP